MTQPPSDGWVQGGWTPPQPPQPPQWGPQPPQWGPQQPQPPYQPQHVPQQQWDAQHWGPAPTPKRRRRVGLISSIAALAVLAGGGAATYVAFSSSSSSGAGSPKQAVQKAVDDLQKSDLLGFLNDLAPGERDAMLSPIRDEVGKLKQLQVVKPETNLSAVNGISFAAHNLRYADKTIAINDHVQIVQLTGGTLDVGGDAAKILTSRFMKAAGNSSSAAGSNHVDIGASVRSSGEPIRIATVKVGGRWYPSLFYTVADQAAGHALPSNADAVAATGAASGTDAVRQMIEALLLGKLRNAIGLISPAELGAMHDYGGLLLKQAGSGYGRTGVRITTLDLTTTPLAGGAQRIGLKKLVLTRPDGKALSVAIDNGCIAVSDGGDNQRICGSDLSKYVPMIESFSCGSRIMLSPNGGSSSGSCPNKRLTAGQKQAISDLFSSMTKLGIATSETGGKWYIAPVRTMADLGATVLSDMKGDDLFELMRLAS